MVCLCGFTLNTLVHNHFVNMGSQWALTTLPLWSPAYTRGALVHGIRVDLLSSVLTEIEAGLSKVILL